MALPGPADRAKALAAYGKRTFTRNGVIEQAQDNRLLAGARD